MAQDETPEQLINKFAEIEDTIQSTEKQLENLKTEELQILMKLRRTGHFSDVFQMMNWIKTQDAGKKLEKKGLLKLINLGR